MQNKNQKILSKYLDPEIKITKVLMLDQNEEDEMGRKRGEGKREYNHKLTLYRHALNELKQNKKVEKTIKAAESGHTKAMMSLYEYYQAEDKESAYKWLRLAADNKNKKAIEIYKEVKKEEKDFKKKQKEEYTLRTKEIRNLLSKNINDLKSILELVLENDKNAITLIERCYKYVPLSKEEEKIFNIYDSNDYINYLIALSYKEVDKEKYVTLITRLYDKNKMPELANEFNENKSYIFDDVKTRKIVEDIARASNNVYIKKLVVSGHQETNSESLEFLYMLCENKNRKAVKNVIEYYIEHNKNIDNKYIETIMSYDGLDERNDNKVIIDFAIAKLYKHDFIKSTKNKILSPNEVFVMFEKAANLENETIIKKDAIYELIDCYINGYGTEKNLLIASQYLEQYDPAKAKELFYKHSFLKGEERVRNLFKKYQCKEFDDFCIRNKEKSDKIIRRYINFNEESTINTLKKRDYLLSIGLTIDEIFDDTGYLSESRIASKVKKIEDEIKRKKEEEKRLQEEKIRKEQEKKIIEEQKRLQELEKQKAIEQKIKKEQTEVKTEVLKVKNPSSNTVKFSVPYRTNLSEDDYVKYLKELRPSSSSRIIYDECVRIAKLRAEFNHPLPPSIANMSQRKYQKEYEKYLAEIEKYKERIYVLKNPIIGNYNAYRRKVWDLSENDNIIGISQFIEKLEELYKQLSSYKITFKHKNYKIADREKTMGPQLQVERMFCLLPNYAREITLEVYVEMFYPVVSSHQYSDWVEAFENSEYSKMMTWHEFSSTKSGYYENIWSASENDRHAQSGANARLQMKKQKEVIDLVQSAFSKYRVFVGKNYSINGKTVYIEALVQKINFDFKFYEYDYFANR